ncbi:MAG: efflux RND transporter permease subunit [Candidatus Hinthialibacter antarcticus]|nr:efflux RND transporter permease subunit [Candidatus Hinthialibacter antarcticus]
MTSSLPKGPIAWMARNAVASNLLMICLLVGGVLFAFNVKQEVMPEFQLDLILVQVAYPGASPSEVEKGIIQALEEEVRGLDGIKEVTSTANEGMGSVVIELMLGVNSNKALQDVKVAVDSIQSFPQDAERPIVSLLTTRSEVISLVLYGDVEEYVLRDLADDVRERLLNFPNITQVDLSGVRPREISIEVPQEKLRAYNLTLDEIAQRVRMHAVEIPAGGVKAEGGEILLRTMERRDYGSQFNNVPVISRPDGTQVLLGDIATIIDGFRETDQATYFDGKPAVRLVVFRLGNQRPVEIAKAVMNFVEELKVELPPGVGVATWIDVSELFSDRISLLMRNAGLGLALVLIVLGMFLEIRLAFWVMMGIPISVLGSFLLFPNTGASINMISLFAFIVTLGIIVDDAIVVGENIYEYRQRGMGYLEAAVRGAKAVAMPVTFAVLSNVAAFMPLLFVPGIMGKFFRVIPIIVISVFIFSLIESLFVLPAHLAHQKPVENRSRIEQWIFRQQQRFANALNWFIQTVYAPVMRTAVRYRYITLSCGAAMLIISAATVAGGHVSFVFFPKVDTDVVSVTGEFPFGTSVEESRTFQAEIVRAAKEVLARHGGDSITRGVLTFLANGGQAREGRNSGSHLSTVEVYMVPSDKRPITANQFAKEWREAIEQPPGLESLTFTYSTGPTGGSADIDIQLAHPDIQTLEDAAAELAIGMRDYTGVTDINDGFSEGKPQYDLQLKDEARSLGVTAADLAAQLRSAFYGARAFRQQRERDEIWVMVRLPEEERSSIFDIENYLIRTPGGGEIPLKEAAVVTRGRSYTSIKRVDGNRVVNITADCTPGLANPSQVLSDIEANVLPGVLAKYQGLGYSLEGQQAEQRETMGGLMIGFLFAQLAIFSMLAIPFRSYIQPIIVMSAIPFGIIGAIGGHLIMGYDMSIVSMFGLVALTGVVVNDSLVMVDAANRRRWQEGMTPYDAITSASMRRFRPILLTSLTTFFGLSPMILETSVQARFLIPMAISLGFGIMFSTLIILFLVPSLYMIVEDVKYLYGFEEDKALHEYDAEPEPVEV